MQEPVEIKSILAGAMVATLLIIAVVAVVGWLH